jgi:hypothetical protein
MVKESDLPAIEVTDFELKSGKPMHVIIWEITKPLVGEREKKKTIKNNMQNTDLNVQKNVIHADDNCS